MTFVDAIKMMTPGMIVSCGEENKATYTEIFMKADGSIRFSDSTMLIDDDILKSKEWKVKED